MLHHFLVRDLVGQRIAHGAQRRRGSMVPPDLEDTMNSVVRGSISDRMPRTRTGESESSVRKRTREESGLWYLVMVMAPGGAALADEHHGLQTLGDDGISECLNLVQRVRRIRCEVRPPHVILCAFLRFVGKAVKRCILRMKAAGNAFLHQGFGGGVELFHISRQHEHLLSA